MVPDRFHNIREAIFPEAEQPSVHTLRLDDHMTEQSIQDAHQKIDILASSWCRRNRPESMSTDWGQSILARGLLDAVRTTDSEPARDYLRRWLSYHLAAGIPVTYFVGSWSPGLLVPEISEILPEFDFHLRPVAERIYRVILDKAIRNGSGILLHNVDLPHVYVDTVYFSVPVLARIGRYLGVNDWQDEAMSQLRAHLSMLIDGATGFWIHCQENLSERRSEGPWARGNGWVAMTCAEMLESLAPDSPEYRECAGLLDSIASRLLPLQTGHGLWRTILDEPAAYEETSASAMFLYSMLVGRRHGVLDAGFDEPIERCLDGLASWIDLDGRLLGCSEGTWPGTIEYYLGLAQGEWWWGTGAYLMALAEAGRG